MARTRYRASDRAAPLRALPAAALRAVFREGYSLGDLRRDVLAGMVVGIVALPLAMALAIAVGVPPQHGLYTAIVAGFVVAALGGSRMQVTGPTAAFVVILAPIFTRFGMAGLLVSGMLGGLVLIAMGLARLGRLIQFIPSPVTTGFTAGIATVIATLQLKDLLGLTLARSPEHYFERIAAMVEARGSASIAEASVGCSTLALLLLAPRLTRRVPAPLIALPVAALGSAALSHVVPGFHVATIATRFQTRIGDTVVHGIPEVLPRPTLPWLAESSGAALALDFAGLRELLSGALAIAMLAAIESLLSAVVADGMAQTKHDPDAELLAAGVGNVIAPFFGGIPATGAIARTATNIKAGARSPIAAMVHALAILIAMLALAPLLGYLPMTSLAALLLIVAWNMSEAKHFVHTLRVAPRSDVMVLVTCYALTVGFDMVIGVAVGVVLAAFLFMRRMADVTRAGFTPARSHPRLPGELPPGVAVYEISGPLFFGAAQKAMAALEIVASETRVVILLLDQVHAMDATGLVAFESALAALRRHGCLAILSGARAQPLGVLHKAGVTELPGVTLADSAPEALELALAHVGTTTSVAPGRITSPGVPREPYQHSA